MKYRKINNRSDRKKLRDEIGALQLRLLIAERGAIDEITGRPSNKLGRFHILRVARCPRLEFEPENILLTEWMPTHYAWHHYGPNDPRNIATHDRIKTLRGPDYETRLKEIEAFKQRHDMLYLQALKISFTQLLKQQKGGQYE